MTCPVGCRTVKRCRIEYHGVGSIVDVSSLDAAVHHWLPARPYLLRDLEWQPGRFGATG
ncbi:hypothetical protein MPNT_190062 [Candidatus Methylacidithermus pantelleriae]|uniref:Uncharacterized protein n=1 Tax=Candidatus Methylacidithermus pantelleriae TaxID=2744239 RepID=A0A8J2BP30_9BACT|nr:hypothetical protein MPNT_190062 [Candidatus Methylacidithermus pantelleriae]